jgi:hypothetical protein
MLLDDMSDKSPPRSWKRKIFVWLVRAIYISVILAMCDVCSLSRGSQPIFSGTWFRTSNEDAGYIGFGYCLVNYVGFYRDGGRTLGPEVWFWFTPVIISGAHGSIEVRWLWKH